MNEGRLTERQRRLAEEQHHVLVEFLKRRHLAMDEYYDIVVFPFLEAVCEFDGNRDLSDDMFKTLAVRSMNSVLNRFFENRKRQNKEVVILSLDYPVSRTEGISYGDTIAYEGINPYEAVERKLSRPVDRYRLLHRDFVGKTLKHINVREVRSF